jgi:hypothetical protein
MKKSVLPDLNARFSTWLLRPYLDLCCTPIGRTRPLHVQNLEQCWRSFADPCVAAFTPQRALASGFRTQLANEAGPSYDLSDPRDLAPELRTRRWSEVCNALDEWPSLSVDQSCRLAVLLHSLCFYRPLIELIPNVDFVADCAEPKTLRLAFLGASAAFIHHLPHRTSDYHSADLSIFEDIAINTSCPSVAFDAAIRVFVHKAKTRRSLQDLVNWGDRLEIALRRALDGADKFKTELLKSRFYRAMGFLPQRNCDRGALIDTMDLAERHARNAMPTSEAEQLLYLENLHAVLESRTKEALWLNDMDAALSRSLEIVEIDPCDSKAWVEVGEVHCRREDWAAASRAYVTAAMLGPPANAVARYMAGICFRKLGIDALAAYFLKETLEMDPLGISSRYEIDELRDSGCQAALKEWNHSTSV